MYSIHDDQGTRIGTERYTTGDEAYAALLEHLGDDADLYGMEIDGLVWKDVGDEDGQTVGYVLRRRTSTPLLS